MNYLLKLIELIRDSVYFFETSFALVLATYFVAVPVLISNLLIPCVCTINFVVEFELFTSEVLSPLIRSVCFRFTFVVEFELFASEVLTSYVFPN